MKILSFPRLLQLVSVALLSIPVASLGECDSAPTYYCPNCGGQDVSDCQQECTGFTSTDMQSNLCINRQLFRPFNTNPDDPENIYHYLWNDLVAMVIWFVAAGVAISCGVGGGGIYVPLGMLLLQFAPKQASGLSQCSIFGASLGGLILNLRNRHPIPVRDEASSIAEDGSRVTQRDYSKKETMEFELKGGRYFTRPLINYDMVLYLAPMEMSGALLGVTIQRVVPNWLFLLCAALVLGFTGYKTFLKAMATRRKENAKFAAQRAEEETDTEKEADTNCVVGEKEETVEREQAIEDSLPAADYVQIESESNVPFDTEDAEKIALREKYLLEDQQQFPRNKFLALAVLWIVLFLLTLLLGGKGSPSLIGITCQDAWFYVLLAIQFVWLFCFAGFNAMSLMKKQKRLDFVYYPVLQDDTVWDVRAVTNFGFFTFLAGVVAGLIGIGGGMILNPLMIHMGVNLVVSSATTATMIVMTSSSVAFMAITTGLVPWSYAVFFFFVTLTGALVGKSQIDKFIRRTGRSSVLIFTLASIITFSTVGIIVTMMLRISEAGWCLEGFKQFCSVSSTSSGECPVDRLLSTLVSVKTGHTTSNYY